jgi:hypothetical protein
MREFLNFEAYGNCFSSDCRFSSHILRRRTVERNRQAQPAGDGNPWSAGRERKAAGGQRASDGQHNPCGEEHHAWAGHTLGQGHGREARRNTVYRYRAALGQGASNLEGGCGRAELPIAGRSWAVRRRS